MFCIFLIWHGPQESHPILAAFAPLLSLYTHPPNVQDETLASYFRSKLWGFDFSWIISLDFILQTWDRRGVYQELTCALLITWVLFLLCCAKMSFWHAEKSNKDAPVYCAHKSFSSSQAPTTTLLSVSAVDIYICLGTSFQMRSGSVFSKFWNVLPSIKGLLMYACKHQVSVCCDIKPWNDSPVHSCELASRKMLIFKWKECQCTNVDPWSAGLGSVCHVFAGNCIWISEYSQSSWPKKTWFRKTKTTRIIKYLCFAVLGTGRRI